MRSITINSKDDRDQNAKNAFVKKGFRDLSIFHFGNNLLFNLLVKGKGSPFKHNDLNSTTRDCHE